MTKAATRQFARSNMQRRPGDLESNSNHSSNNRQAKATETGLRGRTTYHMPSQLRTGREAKASIIEVHEPPRPTQKPSHANQTPPDRRPLTKKRRLRTIIETNTDFSATTNISCPLSPPLLPLLTIEDDILQGILFPEVHAGVKQQLRGPVPLPPQRDPSPVGQDVGLRQAQLWS